MENDELDGPRSTERAHSLGSLRLGPQTWWVFLACGVGLVILGVFALLRTWDSMDALADVASITFVVDALLLYLLASQAEEWRGLYVVSGVVATAALLALVFFEGREPFRFAMVLAGVLGWRGLIDLLVAWAEVSDPASPSRSPWDWVLLAVGALSMLLALASVISRGGSIRLIFFFVSAYALLRGLGMIAVSSRLRELTD